MAIVERTGSFKELTALRDAERQSDSTLNVSRYRDLDLFFTRKSKDNDVNVLTNITAIKRSVRNLVLTDFYEIIRFLKKNFIDIGTIENLKKAKKKYNFYFKD